MKVVLIILGVLALLTIAAVGSGYWWWKHSGADMIKEAAHAYGEARKAGASMDETACLDRGVAVLKTPEGQSFGGAVRNNVVLKGCLETSKLVAPFCTGVPVEDSVMKQATWQASACQKLGATDSFCPQLMGEVAKYCISPARAAKVAKGG